MHIDVFIVTRSKTGDVALHDINGLTYFKNNYAKYFVNKCDIFIRWISPKSGHVGSWRFIRNRSENFYRCKKLPDVQGARISQAFIKILESETFNEQIGEEFYAALGDDSD